MQVEEHDQEVYLQRKFELAQVFTPREPVRLQELFAGADRRRQVDKLVLSMLESGAIVLYGERGVGKTSLVKFAEQIISPHRVVINTVGSRGVTFARLWKVALNEVLVTPPQRTAGFGSTIEAGETVRAGDGLRDDAEPADVVSILKRLPRNLVFTFDEFDRIEDSNTTLRFADTIKAITDLGLPIMLVIVGVGDDLGDLFAAHESVERSLRTVHLTRMVDQEIADVLHRGFAQLGMTVDAEAVQRVVRLSRGLPHYAHLLGFHAATAALNNHSLAVDLQHVERASYSALDEVQAAVREHYKRAVSSGRKDATYAQLLTACALTSTDEQSYFRPVDVCGPMSFVLGRDVPLASFSPKLAAFTKAQRGGVLTANRKGGRPKYRFADPLLQPYALLRALSDGIIRPEQLEHSV